MRRTTGSAIVGALALVLAHACGDVPTLPAGIAYFTPIQSPSPSLAYGDTLRDSLGRAAPLRVYAIGRDSADTIRNVSLRFLLTSLNTGATIDSGGYLVAGDSLTTLRIVAQLTGGASGSDLQLQTSEFSIDVVPRADSIVRSASSDTAVTLPVVTPLGVLITGQGPTSRGPVGGIPVTYRIAQIFPSTITSAKKYYLSTETGAVLRPDSLVAIDTTSATGVAMRSFAGLVAPAGETNADSVIVEATAYSQRHIALLGSPVRFTIRFKR